MPLVSRWGSKVTSVPAREPKANSPKPLTLTARPIPVDLESKAESLGSLVGRPIPGFKELSTVIPPAPPAPPSPSKPSVGPKDLYGDVIAPANGPTDLSALEDLNNSLYSVKIGAGSRIDLGDPGVFQFENELNREVITISAWIKMTGSPMNDDSYDFTVFDYRDDVQRGFGARVLGGQTTSFTVIPPKILFYAFSESDPGAGANYDEGGVSATAEGIENVPAQNEWSYVMFSFDRTASNPEDGIKIWLDGRELPVSRATHGSGFTGLYRKPNSQLSVGAQPQSPSNNNPGAVYVDDIVMRRIHSHPLVEEVEGLAGPESESWLGDYSPEALYTCGDYEDGLGSRIRTINHYLPSGSDVSHLEGQFIGDVQFVEPGAPGTRKKPSWW